MRSGNYYLFDYNRSMPRLAKSVRLLHLVLAAGLFGYIIFMNTHPFTETVQQTMILNPDDIRLDPLERFEFAKQGYKVNNPRIYAISKVPYNVDSASIEMKVTTPDTSMPLEVGYSANDEWNFNSKDINNDVLNKLSIKKLGGEVNVFSSSKQLLNKRTALEYLAAPNAVIGQYGNTGLQNKTSSPAAYTPSVEPTVITTALRGTVEFYTYLKGENFVLKLQKKDLNWYDGGDPTNIKIYKEDVLVQNAVMPDDGITDGSKQSGQTQEITIKSSGHTTPEAGVYRVEIQSGQDSLITRLETSASLLAFVPPLFIAQNTVYGLPTQPSTIWAQGTGFTLKHVHSAAQNSVTLNGQKVNAKQQDIVPIAPTASTAGATITSTQSDYSINGLGYLYFGRSHLFKPLKYNLFTINELTKATTADFIISDYQPPEILGKTLTIKKSFTLPDAFYRNGMLRWQIRSSASASEFKPYEINKLTITYTKKGWIK